MVKPKRILLLFFPFSILTCAVSLFRLAEDLVALRKHCSVNANAVPQDVYWNDFQEVRDYLNRLATGSKDVDWQQHLRNFSRHGRFKKALILFCQTGSLEAELYSKGLIDQAVGLDHDENKIIEARQRANEYNLPFKYFHVNDLSLLSSQKTFPGSGYDLIINNDLDYITEIDLHLTAIHRLLKRDGGIFVTYARVRGQETPFTDSHWQRIQQINRRTDPLFRNEHLIRELRSEHNNHLVVPKLHVHFHTVWSRSLNGALAYVLLSKNSKLSHATYGHEKELQEYVSSILQEDEKYAQEYPGSNLFWFGVLKAKRRSLYN